MVENTINRFKRENKLGQHFCSSMIDKELILLKSSKKIKGEKKTKHQIEKCAKYMLNFMHSKRNTC